MPNGEFFTKVDWFVVKDPINHKYVKEGALTMNRMDNAIRVDGLSWSRTSRVRSGKEQEFWLSTADHAAILEQAETQRKENVAPGGADASDSEGDGEDDSDDDGGDGVFERGPVSDDDDDFVD